MENNQTIGLNVGASEFMSAESSPDKKTKSVNDNGGGDMHGMRFVPVVIQSLEEHFSFSVLLVSVIGYIVIASFGQMNNLWQFFGYLFFLITLLFFYKYKSLETGNVIKKINRFLLIGFSLLLSIIILLLLTYFCRCDLRNILFNIIIFLDKI